MGTAVYVLRQVFVYLTVHWGHTYLAATHEKYPAALTIVYTRSHVRYAVMTCVLHAILLIKVHVLNVLTMH